MHLPKALVVIMHCIAWLLLFGLIIGFVSLSPGGTNIFTSLFTPSFTVFCSIYIFLFYTNANFLIPELFFRQKYMIYFCLLLLLLVMVMLLEPFQHIMQAAPADDRPPVPGFGPPHAPRPQSGMPSFDIISIILFIMIWSVSTVVEIVKKWHSTERRAAKAETEKANAELSFLKAQINPHFLFNTLNNIYSLSVTKSDKAAVSIMKLSNIMRYVTDDVHEDYVPLQSEVSCIEDYIDLQAMRLSSSAAVNFSVTGNVQDKRISPLILMTFVENVFKYGISNHAPSPITISLSAEQHSITFFCRNKVFDNLQQTGRKGIGIANTRQRLEHLYPNRHSLHITTENGHYTVRLIITV